MTYDHPILATMESSRPSAPFSSTTFVWLPPIPQLFPVGRLAHLRRRDHGAAG